MARQAKQLSFGLVTMPVYLELAARPKDVRFNQITPDGNRTKSKTFDAETGAEVVSNDLRKGYEWTKDHYVVLAKEEVEACAPEKSNAIEIKQFVDPAEVEIVRYEKSYYLIPAEGGERPYRLLTEALRETGKVGIALSVMNQKQQLMAIRVMGDALVATTLFYDDELSSPEWDGKVVPTPEEMELATTIVESSSRPFRASDYRDGYREALMDLIAARAQDAAAKAPAPKGAATPAVVPLMEQLRASVEAAKKAKTVKPAAKRRVA